MNDERKKGQKLLELQAYLIGTDSCSDNVRLQFQQRKFAKKGSHIYMIWIWEALQLRFDAQPWLNHIRIREGWALSSTPQTPDPDPDYRNYLQSTLDASEVSG
jgi:hypothetical protein